MIEFKIITNLPVDVKPTTIDLAVYKFVHESHCKDDRNGLITQSLENIANAIVFKNMGQYFWGAFENGELKAYSLTHLSKDVDNSLCYYITQAWAAKEYKRSPLIKIWFNKLRDHAKNLQCRHIIIPSSRHTKPYLRWLGKQWHEYVTLLKEDIN